MDIIAHRGASGLEPANTESAFSAALEIGCDMIETDVHICGSGEAVIFHDPYILRDGQVSFIKEIPLAELAQYDAGNGQPIPTLDRILRLVNGRTRMNLELKSPGSAVETARVLQQAVSRGPWKTDDFLITSFDHFELEMFRAALPDVPRGALVKCLLLSVNDYLDRLDVDVLVTSLEFVRPSLVEEIHTSGRKLMVYTANSENEIRYLDGIGVDGAITNFPDRARRVLERS